MENHTGLWDTKLAWYSLIFSYVQVYSAYIAGLKKLKLWKVPNAIVVFCVQAR